MRKNLLKGFIIGLLVVLSFGALTACDSGVNKEEVLAETRAKAEAALTEKGYLFTDVSLEFKDSYVWGDGKEYTFYKLTVSLETETPADYETVWDTLIALDNSHYDRECFQKTGITIMEYASYEGDLYELDSLNSWYLNRLDERGYEDYSFKYLSAKVPHPKAPYVGMPEDLINFTEIGEYKSKYRHEGDSQHKHWVTYTYYFYENDKMTYIVVCENGYVKTVKGPND